MIRSLLSRAHLVLLAALLLPVSACDSGGSSDEPAVEDGRTSVSISGEASGSFDGFAYFYEYDDPNSEETIFGLVLTNTDTETPQASSEFVILVRQSSRPDAGTYSFANFDDNPDAGDLQSDSFLALVSSATADQEVMTYYISNGGSLTIDQSSDDAVRGSFEIDATGFQLPSGSQQPEEVDITVEGEFNANPSSAFFFPVNGGTTTN